MKCVAARIRGGEEDHHCDTMTQDAITIPAYNQLVSFVIRAIEFRLYPDMNTIFSEIPGLTFPHPEVGYEHGRIRFSRRQGGKNLPD